MNTTVILTILLILYPQIQKLYSNLTAPYPAEHAVQAMQVNVHHATVILVCQKSTII